MTPINLCPVCGCKLAVMETRTIDLAGFQTIWRRRKCIAHGGRYTSIELPEDLARDVLSDD